MPQKYRGGGLAYSPFCIGYRYLHASTLCGSMQNCKIANKHKRFCMENRYFSYSRYPVLACNREVGSQASLVFVGVVSAIQRVVSDVLHGPGVPGSPTRRSEAPLVELTRYLMV